jgi:hypothetical protein
MHITMSAEKAGIYDLRMQPPADGEVHSRRVSVAGCSDDSLPEADGSSISYSYSFNAGGFAGMQRMVGGRCLLHMSVHM